MTDRYHERLAGTLSCYDRIVITGTLPGACYAAGMTSFLNARHIRIFDYPRFAEPLRDRIREAAQALATAQGARIEHVAKAHIRKEDLVAAVRKDRGDHPGLVHVLSAMEACDAYEPWHDKPSHQTFLRHTSGKCLHYYFYWMDETLGLIYLRVPTWSPFRLQFYCNGHSRLAHSLTTAGIDYAMADNAFIRIADWERAQQLADAFSPDTLHALLDRYASPITTPVASAGSFVFLPRTISGVLLFSSGRATRECAACSRSITGKKKDLTPRPRPRAR
jgi:hypothetical protein